MVDDLLKVFVYRDPIKKQKYCESNNVHNSIILNCILIKQMRVNAKLGFSMGGLFKSNQQLGLEQYSVVYFKTDI